ncbi:MAG TPA: IS3 family transposase [Ferruginibacter sp.]|nr:IS3 family transposase [Ferruginibacter sp.]
MFACHLFGINRQVYYRSLRRKAGRQSKAAQVVEMIAQTRVAMPRIGARKLYYLLLDKLQALKIGRDKFFGILRANHLLVEARRSYHVTTDSHHRFRKHKNLILEMSILQPEQVWVSDITYIGKREKPCYLSLVTDAYSKKIMGYYVADNMNTESSVMALKMAVKNRQNEASPLIHHSDRGVQYCSDCYQKILLKNKIQCSMTNNGDPYENAVAERINGILKQEFFIDTYHADINIMRKIVNEAVSIYNNQRPHYSNYMLTPKQMHNQSEIQIRTYKRKNSSRNEPTTV